LTSDSNELRPAVRASRLSASLDSPDPHASAELESATLSECVATVASSLMAEPARRLEEDAASAWDEAVVIANAEEHAMHEVLVQDLGGLAADALGRLSLPERRAVWAHLEPHESGRGGDLWDRRDADQVDPFRALPGCLDEAEARIVRRVLGALADSGGA
jgi:hypothetical protein